MPDDLITPPDESDDYKAPSIWDVICDKGILHTDLRQLIEEIDTSPNLRSASTLQSLTRVRETLDELNEETSPVELVEIHLLDVVVLVKQVLQALR